MSDTPDDFPQVPGFGQLGEDPADFERRRIAGLDQDKAIAQLREIHNELVREREVEPAPMPALRLELAAAMKPLIGEAFANLTQFLGDLRHDIQAQTDLMRVIEAPMEAIADSHERASESFETLRRDLQDIGMETPAAIKDLARVMDTAGLNDAQSRAEKRFEALAISIERHLTSIVEVQNKSFQGLADDMVKILHLLERLQNRELRDAQQRAKKRVKA